MASVNLRAQSNQRERGIGLVRDWTWAAGIGGAVLTALIAVLAASSFAGHTVAASGGVAPGDASSLQQSGDNVGPQAAPGDTFGNSYQPPAVVSGGS